MMIRWLAVAAFLVAGCTQDADEAATQVAAPQAAPAPAMPERRPAPDGASAYIIAPMNGAVVENPVRVVFGLTGAGVIPAGIEREGAGHHHLLIDTDLPNLDAAIPADENHRHFGGGQTETELELAPGTHTLQLLLGDERHIPHDPPIMSERITIQVR